MCSNCLNLISNKKLIVFAFVIDRDSGSESKIASDILRKYLAHGASVRVLTSSQTPTIEISKLFSEFGQKVEVKRLEFSKFFEGRSRPIFLLGIRLWHQNALRRKIEQETYVDFDLGVHISFSTFIFGSPLSRLKIPYIFGPAGFSVSSMNSLRIMGMSSIFELIRNQLIKLILQLDFFVRQSLLRAVIVIPTDTRVEEILKRYFSTLTLTPPIPHFSSTEIECAKKLNTQRIIWVGHYIRKKDPLIAIEAFETIADLFEDVTLHFYGNGPLERNLIQRISASRFSERIFLNGWLPSEDLYLEISNSEILIHTALRETAGNQILESIILGTKVITSNRTNLYTWLSVPGVSYIEVKAGMTRANLATSYGYEIVQWLQCEPRMRLEKLKKSKQTLSLFSPTKIVEDSLHQYFIKTQRKIKK